MDRNILLTKEHVAEWTKKHGHPPRIMLFTESHNGFGHLNVIDEVVRSLTQAGAEVAVASGSFWLAGTIFTFSGASRYELPTVIEKANKAIVPHTGKPYDDDIEYQKKREQAVTRAVHEFQPDIIVEELYPFLTSYRDVDLNAFKKAYEGHSAPPKLVCLCRDIIHGLSPDGKAHTLDTLNTHFSHILVRGDGMLNKLEDCEKEWRDIKIPIEYMGNIVKPMPPTEPIPEESRPVIVSSGGGWRDEDKPFYERAMESRQYSMALKRNPWKIVVSTNCPQKTFEELEAKAKRLAPDGSISVSRPYASAQFRQDVANCAAAIVRGGYSANFELTSAGRPFVIVPRVKTPNNEQLMRANVMEARGLAKQFAQKQLAGNPEATQEEREQAAKELADTLDMAKISRATSLDKIDYNGAEHMASKLVQLACNHREMNTQGATGYTATEKKEPSENCDLSKARNSYPVASDFASKVKSRRETEGSRLEQGR